MAYQMAQMPVTLNDLEGHSSVSGIFKCKSSTFVQRSNLQDFNWHARVARSLSDSWASCFYKVGNQEPPIKKNPCHVMSCRQAQRQQPMTITTMYAYCICTVGYMQFRAVGLLRYMQAMPNFNTWQASRSLQTYGILRLLRVISGKL